MRRVSDDQIIVLSLRVLSFLKNTSDIIPPAWYPLQNQVRRPREPRILKSSRRSSRRMAGMTHYAQGLQSAINNIFAPRTAGVYLQQCRCQVRLIEFLSRIVEISWHWVSEMKMEVNHFNQNTWSVLVTTWVRLPGTGGTGRENYEVWPGSSWYHVEIPW